MNAPIAAARLVIPFSTDSVLIGGDWRAADGGATLALEDPSDGSPGSWKSRFRRS